MTDAFELNIEVKPADIDRMGHVNNLVYLRWVQDIAVAHWRAAASQEDQRNLLWVVVRHEIDYKQPALPGDVLRVRTWVGSASRLRFERFTEILRSSDGVLLSKALTIWCPVDAVTGRPTQVSPAVRAAFSV
ncbi:MAG: thioesterase family protein [Candidatus Solibacter sp.]